ncbi:MAG: HigA family addiction module antitoxin [Bacteroidia bacterium]
MPKHYAPDMVFHPGETLREKLEELGMGSKEFAIRTGKPEKTISNVLNGKSNITPEMAMLFEQVLQIPARFWLNRQAQYDESVARSTQRKLIEEGCEWARKFPYSIMAKLGWVPPARKAEEKALHLYAFFQIAQFTAWAAYFMDQKLKGQFRISLHGAKDPYALSAWLVRGEQQAGEIAAPPFSKKTLEKALPQLKQIMVAVEKDFFHQAQQLLLRCGVKLLCTPKLPKAPVNGVSRWINQVPIIQLSDRWKRYDIFWFTLFHELGHILLHETRFISMENIEYDDLDKDKEKEADDFAMRQLFSEEEETDFFKKYSTFGKEEIISFAGAIQTHPAIILGRLVFREKVSYAYAQNMGLFKKLSINENDSIVVE